jgi:hypothetical protein
MAAVEKSNLIFTYKCTHFGMKWFLLQATGMGINSFYDWALLQLGHCPFL